MLAGRKRLARIDRHHDRGDELMEGVREELRLMREALQKMDERQEAMFGRHHEAMQREFELNRREHRETRAMLQDIKEVCRVLHVLDELRGRGPGGEPATS